MIRLVHLPWTWYRNRCPPDQMSQSGIVPNLSRCDYLKQSATQLPLIASATSHLPHQSNALWRLGMMPSCCPLSKYLPYMTLSREPSAQGISPSYYIFLLCRYVPWYLPSVATSSPNICCEDMMILCVHLEYPFYSLVASLMLEHSEMLSSLQPQATGRVC
jgi:hypothetical protein